MNREEILAKSKEENKNKDIFEREVAKEGANIGAIAGIVLATILYITQMVLGEGQNLGLFAVMSSIPAGGFVVKAFKLKRKHEILVAIIYVVATIIFAIAHICNLIAASTIL